MAQPEDQAPRCGVCGDPVEAASGSACAKCSSPHHRDCWTFNRGCSVFGCGGARAVPYDELAEDLRTRGLTLTEVSRPPLRLAPVIEGLQRRFWSRLPFLKRTVPAGLGGSIGAVLVATLLGADPVRKGEIVAGMILAGGFYGVVAPFLAPWMLRRPKTLGAVSLLVSVLSFLAVDAFHIRDLAAVPFFLVIFAAALTFAASFSEWIAGHRTRLGQALGSWGGRARAVLAWLAVAFTIVVLASVEDGRIQLSEELLMIAASMGLMGGAVAVPAMEQGKKAFLAAIEPATRVSLVEPGDT